MKNTRRTKRTKRTANTAPLTAIDADIAALADGIRIRTIASHSKPANDTEVPLSAMVDKLHLLKLAQRIRLNSWIGCEEHGGTEREAYYREDCTSAEPLSGIVARFQREIGHAQSEAPIPIGARALHLTVTGSLSEFDLAYLVRACFPMIPSSDVVHCATRAGLEGTVHVFVLTDAGWHPVGPPAWLREAPANDLRVLAPPVTVVPEGVLPGHVRGAL